MRKHDFSLSEEKRFEYILKNIIYASFPLLIFSLILIFYFFSFQGVYVFVLSVGGTLLFLFYLLTKIVRDN